MIRWPDNPYMLQALAQAERAAALGEVPVGAVVVSPEGRVLAAAHNQPRALNDPTAHAEILAIRAACQALGQDRLTDCALYVTLEPCAMCAGAIALARVARLYYGADDPKGGGVVHGGRLFTQATCHHRPEVYGGLATTRCQALLTDFFAGLR